MRVINTIATILAIIGALNWLLVGIFGFNFIGWAFGTGVLATISYIAIGIAGIWLIGYLIMKLSKTEHQRRVSRNY